MLDACLATVSFDNAHVALIWRDRAGNETTQRFELDMLQPADRRAIAKAVDRALAGDGVKIAAKRSLGDACPYERIVELYHEHLPMLPAVRMLHAARRSHLRARWSHDLPTLDQWARYFQHVAASPFLCGRAPASPGRRPFVATLDWLVNPTNLAKVFEGRYHSQEGGS